VTRTGNIFFNNLIACSEVQALAGMYDAAMETIEEALRPGNHDESLRPELYRVRGEVRLALRQNADAEADFREAVSRAQKSGAKMLELRATVSLARSLRDTNRRNEARVMLAEIYNWFTEGFDTADLKDAKALLEELG
jgi:tetratricopeptide (TPR) repeat protein